MLLHTYGACEQQAHAACSRAPVSHACAACLRQTLGPHSHSHICGIASLAHVCLPGPIHHVPSAAATTSRTFCTATGRNHWRPSLSALTRQGRTPSQAMAVGTFQVSSLLFQLEVRRARGVAVAASQRCISTGNKGIRHPHVPHVAMQPRMCSYAVDAASSACCFQPAHATRLPPETVSRPCMSGRLKTRANRGSSLPRTRPARSCTSAQPLSARPAPPSRSG